MRWLLVLLLVCFGISTVFAAGLSDVEKGIFELEHIGMQIQAVEIEMRLQLAQEEKDSVNYHKGASIKPAKKAVDDLNNIKTNLSALSLPPELNELRAQFVGVIDKLFGIYSAVAKKVKIDQEKEFKTFWDLVEAYNKNLKAKIDGSVDVPKDLKAFNLLSLETSYFSNQEDKDKFQTADKLITGEKKYTEAAVILKDLLSRYKDTTAEGSIIVRLVDCAQMGDQSAFDELKDPEYPLVLLNSFVAKKSYSPQIQRIYLQWRTIKQVFENGLSNWSGIPNEQYIKTLWELAQSLEQYIGMNSDDHWAKLQLLLLMDTPLIERWRSDYPYGSSVAIDHCNLWGVENAP